MHIRNRVWFRLSVWVGPEEGVLVICSSSRARAIEWVLRESAVSSLHGIRRQLLVGCSLLVLPSSLCADLAGLCHC